MLTLRTFGECRIEIAPVPGESGARAPTTLAPDADRIFSLALLLAGEAGRLVPRGRAAAWLWPELDTRRARRCLRQALYRLRALGVPVESAADHLRLPVEVVAPTFAAAPSAARLAAEWEGGALRLGRCLPGWAPATDAFGDWVDAYRARQEGAARASLATALDTHADPVAAAAVARALLDLDPANADAARVLAGTGRATFPPASAPDGDDAADLPLIGRAALVAALATRVRDALAGRGGAVGLAGASGIGTSRLLGEATRAAEQLGAAVVRAAGSGPRDGAARDGAARGQASRSGDPLGVCRALVGRLLERPGALGAAPATLTALRAFAAGAGAPAAGSAGERLLGTRIAELAGAVAAERALVLAVDDARPADRRSLTVLARAAGALGSDALLVVWAARDDGSADGELGGVTHVLVPPLGTPDAGALARAAASAARGALSDADAAWCATAGAGAPRDVIALARHCAAAPGARTAPPALAARYVAAVVALPVAARHALQATTVLGVHATASRVAHATAGGEHAGRRAIAALRAAGLVEECEEHVSPTHPFVTDAARSSLGTRERRALHARTAAALEHDARTALGAGGTGAADLVEAAAAHWRAARAPERATVLLAAARAALLVAGRAAEAAALFGRALDGVRRDVPDDPRGGTLAVSSRRAREVAALEMLVAGTLFAAGDARGAAAVAERAAAGRRTPLPDDAELLALQSAWRAGHGWAPLLARARRLATDACAGTAARLEAVALTAALADNCAAGPLTGPAGGTLADIGAALDTLIDRADAPHPLALRAASIYHVSAGDLVQGVDAAGALARLLLARPLAVDELGPLLTAADALRAGGNTLGAGGVYAQVHAAATRRRLAGYAARAALRVAALACGAGDARAAGRWAHEGERWTIRADDHRLAWELTDVRARVLLAAGAAPTADAAARSALERVRRARSATPRLWRAALTTAAEARLAVGGWRPHAAPEDRWRDGWLLAALLAAHRRFATRTGHDRTAAACVAALTRLGASGRAAHLARAYVGGGRRTLGSPPSDVAAYLTDHDLALPPACPRPTPSVSSRSPSSAPATRSSSRPATTR